MQESEENYLLVVFPNKICLNQQIHLDGFVDAKQYIQKIVNYLEETSLNPSIQDYHFNNKRDHFYNDIEIWVENNGISFTLHNLLNNSGIKIISNKRTNNLGFINKNIKRLKYSLKKDKKITILYFGNFDLF